MMSLRQSKMPMVAYGAIKFSYFIANILTKAGHWVAQEP